MKRFLSALAVLSPFAFLGTTSVTLSGCYSCPESTCSGQGSTCHGNTLVTCHLYEGDPCVYHYQGAPEDCAKYGGTCVDDHCEYPPEPCPNGVDGVCRFGQAFRCVGGLLPDAGQPCTGDTRCLLVPDGSAMRPVCALTDEPCGTTEPWRWECQGSSRVLCNEGYPVAVEACDAPGASCIQGSLGVDAQCGLDLPCPESGTLCDNNVVYGCETTDVVVALRDCSPLGDHCVTRGERSLCATTEGAPRDQSWRAVPGGPITPLDTRPGDPPLTIAVSAFEMLEHEVTVGEYDGCVRAGACTAPDSSCQSDFFTTRPWLHADLPVGCVGSEQAKAYCEFVGGKLPLDFEWEYAFRNGGDDSGFTGAGGYVWCEDTVMVDPNTSLVGCGRGETWPGCTHPGDVTEQGICDLVGNLKEWVEPTRLGVTAAVWGISAWSSELGLRHSYESSGEPDGTIGFRCLRRPAP